MLVFSCSTLGTIELTVTGETSRRILKFVTTALAFSTSSHEASGSQLLSLIHSLYSSNASIILLNSTERQVGQSMVRRNLGSCSAQRSINRISSVISYASSNNSEECLNELMRSRNSPAWDVHVGVRSGSLIHVLD